jgi:hypothetical protein
MQTPVDELIASLATPEEWQGLAPNDQAVYLAELNSRGLRLLAEKLAAAQGHPPRLLLAAWLERGLISSHDARYIVGS